MKARQGTSKEQATNFFVADRKKPDLASVFFLRKEIRNRDWLILLGCCNKVLVSNYFVLRLSR